QRGTPIALLCQFRDATEETNADADEEDEDRDKETDEKQDKDEAGEGAVDKKTNGTPSEEEDDPQAEEKPAPRTVRMKRKQQQWRIQVTPRTDKAATEDSRGDESLLPVQVGWNKYPFPTRPYTLRDFRLLRARRHPRTHWRAQKRFDLEPKVRRRSERNKIPRLAAHARTVWNLDKPGSFHLGAAEAEQSCWFLFVDGRLVADWQTAAPNKDDSGTRLSRDTIRLDDGLHAVDFFSVVKPDEPLPNPVFADVDNSSLTKLAEADLLPPVSVDSLRFEQLDDEESPVRNRQFERRRHLLFEEAPSAESLIVPEPQPADAQRRSAVRDFAPRHVGVPSLTAVSATLEIESIPFLQPLASPFMLQPRLNVSSQSGQVSADTFNLEVVVRSRSGKLETRKTITPDSLPFAPRLPLSLTAQDQSVLVRARFGEQQILPEQEIRLISAVDFGPSLTFAGDQAMINDDPVCLLWEPKTFPSSASASHVSKPLRRLYILDDFWDVTPVPSQKQSGADRLSASLDIPVTHISSAAMRSQGIPDRVAKFAMLAQAMKTASVGDHIMFAVGANDLGEDRQALDLVAELDFLAEVCRVHRLLPVFVTVPTPYALGKARARRAALYTKELAVRRQIPVVDLYSAAKLDEDAPFPPSASTDETRSRSQKRRWIYEQIRALLTSFKK
ncbi:MAG: SGNH/GDSL hydrolase family protein, partial [bacterium]